MAIERSPEWEAALQAFLESPMSQDEDDLLTSREPVFVDLEMIDVAVLVHALSNDIRNGLAQTLAEPMFQDLLERILVAALGDVDD